MPIHSYIANPRFQKMGTIRMGYIKESAKGKEYPEDADHFVLTDAQEVIDVYGEKPKVLDAIFLSDDLEQTIPHWFKMHANGRIGPDGKRLGGKLLCKGPGPIEEEINGEMVKSPGDAEHFAERDPVTRVVPTRPCMGFECPDYKAKKCKTSMKVLFFLPLVSPLGGFVINTTSKYAIESFVGLLTHYKRINNGKISFIPFKIVREATSVTYWDENSQSDKVGIRHIMYLRSNPKFYEIHGQKAQEVMGMLEKMKFSLKGVSEEIDNEPMEDHWPALPAGSDAANVVDLTAAKKLNANEVLSDPEVDAAFSRLETAMGKKFDQKARLIAIRKKENEPDLKAAVLDELNRKIAEVPPKTPPPQVKVEPVIKASGGDIL